MLCCCCCHAECRPLTGRFALSLRILLFTMPRQVSSRWGLTGIASMMHPHVLTRAVLSLCVMCVGHGWAVSLSAVQHPYSSQHTPSLSRVRAPPTAPCSTITTTLAITAAALPVSRRRTRSISSRATRSNRRSRQTRRNTTRDRPAGQEFPPYSSSDMSRLPSLLARPESDRESLERHESTYARFAR